MEINNKVVIVTGGVGGIGFSTVRHFLKNGAKYVGIFDIPAQESPVVVKCLKTLEEEYKRESFGYYKCDVRNVDDFIACYDNVAKVGGYVDILVNNAAVANDLDINLTVDVNFKAVVHCCMIAIDHMRKDKGHNGGVIVNIASFLGVINMPLAPVYNASKHAVVSFVKSMMDHNKVLGVRMMCICPGMTDTNMVTYENLRSAMFDFVPDDIVAAAISTHLQKPDNVASAIIEIVRRGKEGDVWVAQNDEAPFAVGEKATIEELRIPF